MKKDTTTPATSSTPVPFVVIKISVQLSVQSCKPTWHKAKSHVKKFLKS
uniref:Uncharacterized protein n=1 Tax=Anguilla anguilla TaxID=7936 RepID=A0A0E9WA55_ANGAN